MARQVDERASRARLGTGLVALAAALWATDLFFRRGPAEELPAAEVVFWEHLILAFVSLPVLVRGLTYLRSLREGDWLAALLIGAGASVIATVLFTAAFAQGDPTTVLLLQKLQPLLAVVAARVVLGERPLARYWTFAVPAIAGAYLLSVPDPLRAEPAALTPALLAVGAAALWALGTVLGKHLSAKVPYPQLTALRFVIGLPVAAVVLLVSSGGSFAPRAEAGMVPTLLGLALVPGLLALTLYYRGLRTTPAVTATLAELSFPLTSVVLAYAFFDASLSATQWLGLVLVAASITALGVASERGSRAVGVEHARRVVVGAGETPA